MKMESQLKELKSVLRSLVVSSPTEVDLRTLLRDYRNMMGEPIPLLKFGYRDGLAFITEQCSDCFLVQDSSCNPILTLIVPDAVKHIDKFVQKQKTTAITRFKGKRRSVPEAAFRNSASIVKTFKAKANNTNILKTDCSSIKEDKEILHNSDYSNEHVHRDSNSEQITSAVYRKAKECTEVTNGMCSSNALQNFMKKRMPICSSSQYLDSETCKDSSRGDTESGRQTSSSMSSNKKAQLEELKTEIRELIAEVPEGVWCTELVRLYREKYGRELNFARFGFTSVLSLAYAVDELQYCVAEHTGDLLLRAGEGRDGAAGPRVRTLHPGGPLRLQRHEPPTGDPEDALPGIEFDEDVFPRDCMHIMQSIPTQPLDELAPGAMLQVVLGEVYSPTHFWLLRLGPAHYSAMESLMDDMNSYYRGEGRERVLAGGAVRVGHYCACCYLGDWHRAVIVKIVDSDTVKVRHIDYATVEAVAARSLKPLLRCWAALPAQALRARMAGVRPPAVGRRWPWAAAAHFLSLVKERRLVANVVAKDMQEGILEVLLIDTSTEEDVCISTEMCRSGHADPRPDSALGTSECYLYPRFNALETGDTPNYAEIYCYLRDGISLEFVEDYRRHVPSCLPPPVPISVPSRPSADFRVHSPSIDEPSIPTCEPPPTPRESTPGSPIDTATRSLSQLADQSSVSVCTERVSSLSPPTENGSWAMSVPVVNRIPLLRPELSVGPPPTRPPPQRARQPQNFQSLPSDAFPSSGYPPTQQQPHPHLSPFAPPFYPQSIEPPLCPFSVFLPARPHIYSSSYPTIGPHPPPGPVTRVPPGGISVPASDCEIFTFLSRVDPVAAHRYMVDALSRAVARTCVINSAPTPIPSPPGFERYLHRASPAQPRPDP